jgi:hypothetical protein
MTNADRECNSPDAIPRHADHPISLTKGSESVRNNAETGFAGALGPKPGTQAPATQREAGAIRAIFARAPKHLASIRPHAQWQSKVPCLPGRGIDALGRFRPRKAACRLNFTAKPPSSG